MDLKRSSFNVRVYGILVNLQQEVLLLDEKYAGRSFTKFPGGGLQYGESLPEALKREWMEECGVEISPMEHLYTTDVFCPSFVDQSQVIAVYYTIKLIDNQVLKVNDTDPALQRLRWEPFHNVSNLLTFDLDQRAWSVFCQKNHI
jgi:8-oxo-dGTP diphosphatase